MWIDSISITEIVRYILKTPQFAEYNYVWDDEIDFIGRGAKKRQREIGELFSTRKYKYFVCKTSEAKCSIVLNRFIILNIIFCENFYACRFEYL